MRVRLWWVLTLDQACKNAEHDRDVFRVLTDELKEHAPLFVLYMASHLYTTIYNGWVLWGNNYEASLSQLVLLQIKVARIINHVPLRDHITPHYVNLGLIKLPDIVKLCTFQPVYDHLIYKTFSNLILSLISEQHHYATRSVSLQHLNPKYFRIDTRKVCPITIGGYYWNDIRLSIRNKPTRKLFKK